MHMKKNSGYVLVPLKLPCLHIAQEKKFSWLFCGFHPFLGDKCFRLATTAATTIHVFQQMAGRAFHLVAGSNLSWTASSFKRSLLKKLSLVSNCGKNWKK